jgi:hypothetical protein
MECQRRDSTIVALGANLHSVAFHLPSSCLDLGLHGNSCPFQEALQPIRLIGLSPDVHRPQIFMNFPICVQEIDRKLSGTPVSMDPG